MMPEKLIKQAFILGFCLGLLVGIMLAFLLITSS